MAKVNHLVGTHIPPKQLNSHQRSNKIDQNQEQYHIGHPVHVSKDRELAGVSQNRYGLFEVAMDSQARVSSWALPR